MDTNTAVMSLVAVFLCLACADKLMGNRFGLGALIDEGFYTLGPLAPIMIGMITLSPVIARTLYPAASRVLPLIKADPSLFVGAVLANDCGGAALAMNICRSREAGLLNGAIVASMMGASIGVIPIVLAAVDAERRRYAVLGLLIGFIAIPPSALISGLIAGMDGGVLFYNLLPIAILAAIIATALLYAQSCTVRIMICLGKAILLVALFGFAASAVAALTGVSVIQGMAPIEEAFVILGQIGVALAGIFPLLHLLKKALHGHLPRFSSAMKVNDISVIGLITTSANYFPVIPMLNKMTPRGVIVNMAFAVPAAYAIGDHLGFTAGFERSLLFPLAAGKLSGGILAVMAALWYCDRVSLDE